MDEKRCRECKYFNQHYSLSEGKLHEVYCGHCTFSRLRKKTPLTKACKDFEAGEARAEKFVTKQYLTRELLKRILEMELLPDIT